MFPCIESLMHVKSELPRERGWVVVRKAEAIGEKGSGMEASVENRASHRKGR